MHEEDAGMKSHHTLLPHLNGLLSSYPVSPLDDLGVLLWFFLVIDQEVL